MYCLDANIWIYYLDEGLPEHDTVRDQVAQIVSDEPLFTTTVLQMEVVHYLSNQLEDSSDMVDRFLSIEDTLVADLTRDDVATAADFLGEHAQSGIGGRDATVVAAMKRHDVTTVWTHDSGFKRLAEEVDWLTAFDPIEE